MNVVGEISGMSFSRSINSVSMDVPLVSIYPVDLASTELVTNNEASADPRKAVGMFVIDDGATLNLSSSSGKEKRSTVNPSSELLDIFIRSNTVSINIGSLVFLFLPTGMLSIFMFYQINWYKRFKLFYNFESRIATRLESCKAKINCFQKI